MDVNKIYNMDCIEGMKQLPDGFCNTCVTSPPYWGLRDYGVDGQIGLESSVDEYVGKMVEVFREVKRVLRYDGTLWLNLGDCYAGSGRGIGSSPDPKWDKARNDDMKHKQNWSGFKPKDLIGVPWKVAFALQADGWYLRSDIIWSKPNPMPESVTDRPTKAHEYIFLLSKSERYYYDAEAIKEPSVYGFGNGVGFGHGTDREVRNRERIRLSDKQRGHSRRHAGFNDRWDNMTKEEQCSLWRNKRTVWTVATKPFSEAHFATFPQDLIRPCILAGSPENGIVLDPFMGAGTTGVTAFELYRNYIGFELNADYCKIAENRIEKAVLQRESLGVPLFKAE